MSSRELFLAGCEVVVGVVADPAVADAWNRPSSLEGHTVGSLAAHLVFAGEVELFLDTDVPDGPPVFENAATYYARAIELLTNEVNQGIHARSEADAAGGPAQLSEAAATKLKATRRRLADEPGDRIVQVFGGSMRLDDFLETRIVEQVVHLDDLARSVDVEPWPNPAGAEELVVARGAEIGRLRRGGPAMIRSLFRDEGSAGKVLPVI